MSWGGSSRVRLGGQGKLLCNDDMLHLSKSLSKIKKQACGYLGLGGRVLQGKKNSSAEAWGWDCFREGMEASMASGQ